MAIQDVGSVTPAQGTSLIAGFQRGREQLAATTAAAAKTEREVAIEGQQAEVRTGQIEAQKIENLDARQQQRLKSSVIGAAQLDGFLQSGNIEGARSFLQRRRAELGQRIAAGENVDTAETDEAIQLLDTDLEGLKDTTSRALDFGKQTGILKRPGGGKGLSADLEFANAIQDARSSGDDQRLNDLFAVKKILEKGETIDEEGNITPAPGALETKEALSGAKETGKLKAKLKLEPSVAEAVETAKLIGKEKGLTITELDSKIAAFPRLETMVKELDALSEVATYATLAVLSDTARRRAGLEVSVGGVSRAAYEAKLRTEIFPLLRDTFGAAFTKAEGDSLIETLGNPDFTPAERKAISSAFITGKLADIETLKRKAERQGITILPDEPAAEKGQVIDFNDLPE